MYGYIWNDNLALKPYVTRVTENLPKENGFYANESI